jgi:prolyl oligopeptidase PreP (S9A serine peptidase family)
MTGILNALFASLAGPQNVTVIQSFTATGEWVCPTGVTEVEYLVVAGGGGGGVIVVVLVAVVLVGLELELVFL